MEEERVTPGLLGSETSAGAEISRVGVKQDKKQRKGMVDGGNSKCKIPKTYELLVPG